MDSFWYPIVPREFPVKDDLVTRVPVPAFFQSATHCIAVQLAGGNRAAQAAEETLAEISGIHSIGFILDADTEEPAERFRRLAADLLKRVRIALPSNPGEINTGLPRTGAFIIPDNQSQGALEHLLIDGAQIVYPKLLESARGFIEPIAADPGVYGSDVASAIGESDWRLKATVGHVANVLKPGKAIQNSIEDNR